MRESIIKIGRSGRVLLKIDASLLSGILLDAAREESRRRSQPNKEEVVRLSAELADWFNLWHPDAAEGEHLTDVNDAYDSPDCTNLLVDSSS